jgi:hypothetical protein
VLLHINVLGFKHLKKIDEITLNFKTRELLPETHHKLTGTHHRLERTYLMIPSREDLQRGKKKTSKHL